jgi:FdhD protein
MERDTTMATTAARALPCRQLAGGRFSDGKAEVIIERDLTIYVSGTPLATAAITPGLEREFATGYLFGQGFINNPEDIASIEIEDNAAKITLQNSANFPTAAPGYRIVSGGGRTAFADARPIPRIKSRLRVSRAAVFGAMNALLAGAALYRLTEGSHAAGLFTPEGRIIYIAEDIGRHNCLDKLIGHALLNKIDFREVFLATTGRLASEMVTKICRAGLPLAATKTAVTDAGLAIARRCGLTAIGFVRDAGTRLHTDMDVRVIPEAQFKIYTGAGRVLWE